MDGPTDGREVFMESKILKNFFEQEHRKWKKRAFTIYEYTLGHSHSSQPTKWMNRPDENKSVAARTHSRNKPDRG